MTETAWWRASQLPGMPTDPFASDVPVAGQCLVFCSFENTIMNTSLDTSPLSPDAGPNSNIAPSRDSACLGGSSARVLSESEPSGGSMAASNVSDVVYLCRRSTGDVEHLPFPIPGTLDENGEYEVQRFQM